MTKNHIKVDFNKRKELEQVLGGDQVSYCYQCGACVGDCPTARFNNEFNPREIMLNSLIGNIEDYLSENSPIWLCSNCYNCYERCPQDVRPVEVIIALKNLAVKNGSANKDITDITKRIIETGYSVPIMASNVKLREELGLPPVKVVNTGELKIITSQDTKENKL